MASRTFSALLLVALFGAALFLQVALADEAVVGAGNDDVIPSSTDYNADTTSSGIHQDSTEEVAGEDDEDSVTDDALAAHEGDEETEEVQPYVYVPEADEVEADADVQEQASLKFRRPLARSLGEKPSRRCWSKAKCLKYFNEDGCCKGKCVNLDTCNSHCGKCAKACDTTNGYKCRSGKCKRKANKRACTVTDECKGVTICCKRKCVNPLQDVKNCGRCGKRCSSGSKCCNGKCRKLRTDVRNCGKCGRQCPYGKVCCGGDCVALKTDSRNCGKCGKSCRWGRKCCNGRCKSINSDKNNCGLCGRMCGPSQSCVLGICGYGL